MFNLVIKDISVENAEILKTELQKGNFDSLIEHKFDIVQEEKYDYLVRYEDKEEYIKSSETISEINEKLNSLSEFITIGDLIIKRTSVISVFK